MVQTFATQKARCSGWHHNLNSPDPSRRKERLLGMTFKAQ
jgi:hypothetical protein